MENILRKYSYLDSTMYGEIVKVTLAYIVGQETEVSDMSIIFFEMYVKKDVDRLLKQREITKKGRRKNEK